MKLTNKPSTNFSDHTGRSEAQRAADTVLTNLNPVHAVHKLRGVLLERGVIAPPRRTIQLGMPKGVK